MECVNIGAEDLPKLLAFAQEKTQKPPLHGSHWMAITGKPLAATAGALMFQRGGPLSIGRSKAKIYDETEHGKATFEDVAGIGGLIAVALFLAVRATSYAMESVICDGMDFFDVYEKAGKAIASALRSFLMFGFPTAPPLGELFAEKLT